MAHSRSSTTSVQSVTPVPGLFTATPARLASMFGPRPQGPMHGRARSLTSRPCSSFRALNRRSVSRDPSSRQSRPVHTYISTGGASLVDGVVSAVRVDACLWGAESCWRAVIGPASHRNARIFYVRAVGGRHLLLIYTDVQKSTAVAYTAHERLAASGQ